MVISAGVTLLLLISTVLLIWVLYKLKNTKEFEFDANDDKKVTKRGTTATEFYSTERSKLITAVAGNVVGLTLVIALCWTG